MSDIMLKVGDTIEFESGDNGVFMTTVGNITEIPEKGFYHVRTFVPSMDKCAVVLVDAKRIIRTVPIW